MISKIMMAHSQATIRVAFATPIALPLQLQTTATLASSSKHVASLPHRSHLRRSRRAHLSMTSSTATSTPSSTTSPVVNPARTAVITGASGGIGAETCKGLVDGLPNMEKLLMCCRDVNKGETVATSLHEKLKSSSPSSSSSINIEVIPVDLSDSTSVVQCVNNITTQLDGKPLDLLICNAGVMATPLMFSKSLAKGTEETIAKRIEYQYFVNFLSHALLTDRLLPLLRQSDVARIIFVSSLAVAISKDRKAPPVLAEKTGNVVTDASYSRWRAYGDSKLAMSLYARALADIEKEYGIESISLHPGVVQTELGRYILPKWMQPKQRDATPSGLSKLISSVFGLKTPEQGAELSIELATAVPGTVENGALYIEKGGKKADKNIIPLIDNEQALKTIMSDTKSFIDTL